MQAQFTVLQIENEYEPEDKTFGSAGHAYMTWAAKMALSMNTGVPWVMCKEFDAPDPLVLKFLPLFISKSINSDSFQFNSLHILFYQ